MKTRESRRTTTMWRRKEEDEGWEEWPAGKFAEAGAMTQTAGERSVIVISNEDDEGLLPEEKEGRQSGIDGAGLMTRL
jgi:hypothetical protein